MDIEARIHVENMLLGIERDYTTDWRRDASRAMNSGFYCKISDLVAPKPGQIVVDIGTGLGHQLIDIMMREAKTLTIGTERTHENIQMIIEHFHHVGLEQALAVILGSELESTNDGKVFWKRICDSQEELRRRCRPLLEDKILFLDDDIRFPVFLPAVLGDEKIDAGILSLPGGSSNRAVEWPFDVAGHTNDNNDHRIIEATNHTRFAFYHYMAKNVRPGGRIVIAERIVAGQSDKANDAFFSLLGRHMKDLRKYWNPRRSISEELHPQNAAVELRASDAQQQQYSHQDLRNLGRAFSVVAGVLERNSTPFSENPLPRPS